MDTWEELRDPECRECELYKKAQTVCLIGDGKMSPEYMLIGEAPGEREDDVRKPFQGLAGSLLTGVLRKEFHMRRDQFYITNAVKCRPPGNRTPVIAEIRACRDYLLDEIRLVKPKKIIALGASAIKAVLNDNRGSVKKYRFKEIRFSEFPEIPVFPAYHPSAVLRAPYRRKLFVEDLQFAFGAERNSCKKRKYLLVNDAREAKRILKYAVKKNLIAVDFETTGLDTLAPDFKILTMSITWKEGTGYCIPIEHPESEIPLDTAVSLMRYLFEGGHDVIIGGHNIKYEIKCLLSYGISVPGPIRDSMLEFALLDENYPGKSLELMKLRYTSDLGKREKAIKPYIDRLKEVRLPVVASYNCEDTDATYRLLNIFKPKLENENLVNLSIFQQEATKMLAEVETTGMQINQSLLRKTMKTFAKKKEEIEGMFPGINLSSTQQLSNLLFEKMKLPKARNTKTGLGSTAREDLEALTRTQKGKRVKDKLEAIITWKKVNHFDSHFVTGIFNALKPDGKIYPQYNLTRHEDKQKGKEVGTVTGRLSASLVHQVPRDSTELDKIFGENAVQIKEMFISSFDGGYITQGDYSQAELRLMAEYSQDKNMLDDFASGVDIHTAVTKRIMKIAPKFYKRYDRFEDMRKATKAINFGIIYLISPWALATRLEITGDEAKLLMSSWFKTYPKVRMWLLRTQRQVAREEQSVSLIGRIRRVPGATMQTKQGRELIRQAVNAPIQGLAADITVMLMIALQNEFIQRGMKSRVIGNVHDATLTDTHPKEKVKVRKLYEKLAPEPPMLKDLFGVKLTLPLVMDVHQGKSWRKED